VDPDPSEMERSLVDKLFVSCLQALEAVERDHDVTKLDADELRRLLVQELHDVDVDDPETKTVLDNVNPLLALPREAAESKPDQDFVDVESDPLPKVLIEAFEQHGAFAAVRFRRTKGDLSRQLNWNVIEDPLPDHPTVPDSVDTYQGMWEHYYFGKSLVEDLLTQQRPHVVDRVVEHFDGDTETATEELYASFREFTAAANPTASSNRTPIRRPGFASKSKNIGFTDRLKDKQPDGVNKSVTSEGSPPKDDETDESVDETDESDHESDDLTVFEEWSLDALILAAERLGIDLEPSEDVARPSTDLSVECPFCEFSHDLCGNDRCVTEARRRRYESARPELVWALLDAA
jgi:hypothetical protein